MWKIISIVIWSWSNQTIALSNIWNLQSNFQTQVRPWKWLGFVHPIYPQVVLKCKLTYSNYHEIECCCSNGGSILCQSFDIALEDIGGIPHPEAFISWNSHIGKNSNTTSAKVSGKWMHIFHIIFHEVKIEKLLQWTLTHNCWDVFPNFFHFEHLPIQRMFWWLEGAKT